MPSIFRQAVRHVLYVCIAYVTLECICMTIGAENDNWNSRLWSYGFSSFQGRDIKIRQIFYQRLTYSKKMIVFTSYSAYDATLLESDGVKIDGFLYPNFM